MSSAITAKKALYKRLLCSFYDVVDNDASDNIFRPVYVSPPATNQQIPVQEPHTTDLSTEQTENNTLASAKTTTQTTSQQEIPSSTTEEEEEQNLLLSYEEVKGGNPVVFEQVNSIQQQQQQKDDLISFDQQFKKLLRAQRLLGDYITTAATTTGVFNPLYVAPPTEEELKVAADAKMERRRKQQDMKNVAINLSTFSTSTEEVVHLNKLLQIWLVFHQVGILIKIKVIV